jgi:hypothetical protein
VRIRFANRLYGPQLKSLKPFRETPCVRRACRYLTGGQAKDLSVTLLGGLASFRPYVCAMAFRPGEV